MTRHESPTPRETVSSTAREDNNPLSDNESGERPVREQLKKTTIAGSGETAGHGRDQTAEAERGVPGSEDYTKTNGEGDRGRLRRKRSIEDVEGGHADDNTPESSANHSRKRSRDNISEQNGLNKSADDARGESSSQKMEEDVRDNVTAPADDTKSTGADKDRAAAVLTTEDASQEAMREAVISPKNKRSRDEFLQDQEEDAAASSVEPILDTQPTSSAEAEKGISNTAQKTVGEEPEAKRHRESASPDGKAAGSATSQAPTSRVPASSGFSNTSAVSPFGALAGSKSSTSQPQTSSGAFASSGFAALAGSSTSGFGALGASKPAASPFGAATSGAQTQPSAFGGAASQSSSSSSSAFGATLGNGSKPPFASVASAPGLGSSTSGFGSLGGGAGFGGGFGGLLGGKLSSFASAGGSGGIIGLSDKPAKPFGAADDEEEEQNPDEEDDGDGVKSPVMEEKEKKDKRFFEQDVETGEENESTVFSSRAKLYNFVKDEKSGKKEWKERGLGTLKLNVMNPTEEEHENDAPKRARFIMRADGSHRVVLNSPVQKELKIGDATGGRPTGGYVYFWGSVDGKPTLELLQLKMRQQFADELYQKVSELQKEM